MQKVERFRGSLLGLAAGDALGAAVEFEPKDSFEPLTGMVASAAHDLPAGYWTDDTSMALCLAESLIERNGLDLADQLRRYVRWWREGYLSSTGECFGIGNTTSEALETFRRTGDPRSGPTAPQAAGNGSIMRLAPVPLFFSSDLEKAAEMSAESSRTTHGAPSAVGGCRYLGKLVAGAARGLEKDELLSEGFAPSGLPPEVLEVAEGSFKRKDRSEIRGSGYVVRSLEAALWAFYNSASFEEGALLAVNLGDDADTTGAVYGGLAGTFYGEPEIPQRWREKLVMREKIEAYASRLYELSGR